jgi:hypothetical protein
MTTLLGTGKAVRRSGFGVGRQKVSFSPTLALLRCLFFDQQKLGIACGAMFDRFLLSR